MDDSQLTQMELLQKSRETLVSAINMGEAKMELLKVLIIDARLKLQEIDQSIINI